MDRWIYVTESRRKESGFENLKTRFQDCNLSRKQESKPDGMIERKLSFNRESKLSAKKTSCLCGMNENKKARKMSAGECASFYVPSMMIMIVTHGMVWEVNLIKNSKEI